MKPPLTFQAWLDAALTTHYGGSMSRLAIELRLAMSTVRAWRTGRALPGAALQVDLARVTGADVALLKDLVWHAELARPPRWPKLRPAVASGRRHLRVVAPSVPSR